MRRALALALLIVGCRYRLLPEDRVCEDLSYAISERTLVCTDDGALANARAAAFLDEATCLLGDEVEDPYNPNGILPADENPEENARLEGLYDCVRAARQAPCRGVEVRGDDAAWWLTLHPACADVAVVGEPPADTGASR